jgi:hypothetical protein
MAKNKILITWDDSGEHQMDIEIEGDTESLLTMAVLALEDLTAEMPTDAVLQFVRVIELTLIGDADGLKDMLPKSTQNTSGNDTVH